MEVRVRDRSAEPAWGSGPARIVVRRVEIDDTCPKCGGPRGEARNLNQSDDGEFYSVDVWENPCGHVDTYSAVVLEAARRCWCRPPSSPFAHAVSCPEWGKP